ncbi:hypothetical protein GS393_03521 [Pseudomonas savastanoi pv. phaseolicola]|nr:hypothetical protein [Pseudomonas savastanoi pv. phaseolicola]
MSPFFDSAPDSLYDSTPIGLCYEGVDKIM